MTMVMVQIQGKRLGRSADGVESVAHRDDDLAGGVLEGLGRRVEVRQELLRCRLGVRHLPGHQDDRLDVVGMEVEVMHPPARAAARWAESRVPLPLGVEEQRRAIQTDAGDAQWRKCVRSHGRASQTRPWSHIKPPAPPPHFPRQSPSRPKFDKRWSRLFEYNSRDTQGRGIL